MVGNRYHVLCGDTKNRIFYGVVKYPVCMGCLAGYKPFRLFVMNYNLDIVLHFEKSISCRLFWCFGGYGTVRVELINKIIRREKMYKYKFFQKIRVTGPSGELYGTIMQRFSLLRPNFDLLDENDSRVLSIQGPPIIPLPLSYLQFLTKFKLYQHDPHEEEGEGDQVGIFLEAAYGVGNRNMKNSLRVGFPRDLPIRHKALVLAALFQIVLRSISYFIIWYNFMNFINLLFCLIPPVFCVLRAWRRISGRYMDHTATATPPPDKPVCCDKTNSTLWLRGG